MVQWHRGIGFESPPILDGFDLLWQDKPPERPGCQAGKGYVQSPEINRCTTRSRQIFPGYLGILCLIRLCLLEQLWFKTFCFQSHEINRCTTRAIQILPGYPRILLWRPRKHTPTRYGFLCVRAIPINTTTMAPRISYRLSYLEKFHFSNLLAASEAGCWKFEKWKFSK